MGFCIFLFHITKIFLIPKNVFEIMPILMSLTFWPFYVWLGACLGRFSVLWVGYTRGLYYLPKVIEFILFHTEKGSFCCFAFYFCVKSKLQELWDSVQAWRLNPFYWVRYQSYVSALHHLALWVALFLCSIWKPRGYIQLRACLVAFAFNKLAWGLLYLNAMW